MKPTIDTDNSLEAVRACPFCGELPTQKEPGLNFQHPDNDCFYGPSAIPLTLLEKWNARAQFQPAAKVQKVGREVERMAYGYELMFRAICNIAGTSGAHESWYRQQANAMLERLSPLHSLTADSNQHKPGDCLSQYKKFSPSKAVEPAPEQGRIKTWEQRCEEHPDHETYCVTPDMIQARMQEEIDDLRAALAHPSPAPQQPQSEKMDCPYCGGCGEHDASGARCTVCNGAGVVETETREDALREAIEGGAAAKFWFQIGYGAAYARALIEKGAFPFEYSVAKVEADFQEAPANYEGEIITDLRAALSPFHQSETREGEG